MSQKPILMKWFGIEDPESGDIFYCFSRVYSPKVFTVAFEGNPKLV